MIDYNEEPLVGEPETEVARVKICEVGPRDGLQNESAVVSAAQKAKYIDMLSACGFAMIEATSFVHPKAIPALADAEDVYARIQKRPGVEYVCLVPNERGFARAERAGARAIAVFTGASESFVSRNIGMSIDESLAAFAPIVRTARATGMFVRGYLSTAFACPFEGPISIDRVTRLAERLCDLGIDELSIGDTIGTAFPEQVHDLCVALESHLPVERLAMHFHDTAGRALDNIRTAYAARIRVFDASSGGLGGCPYAPGASGNVATESVVALFRDMHVATDIDATALEAATEFIRDALSQAAPHNPITRT